MLRQANIIIIHTCHSANYYQYYRYNQYERYLGEHGRIMRNGQWGTMSANLRTDPIRIITYNAQERLERYLDVICILQSGTALMLWS